MRLIVSKDLQQGPETVSILLTARVELDAPERDIFERLNGYGPLLAVTLTKGQPPSQVRESALVTGVTWSATDIDLMDEAEQRLTDFCRQFKRRLDRMASHRGETAIDL